MAPNRSNPDWSNATRQEEDLDGNRHGEWFLDDSGTVAGDATAYSDEPHLRVDQVEGNAFLRALEGHYPNSFDERNEAPPPNGVSGAAFSSSEVSAYSTSRLVPPEQELESEPTELPQWAAEADVDTDAGLLAPPEFESGRGKARVELAALSPLSPFESQEAEDDSAPNYFRENQASDAGEAFGASGRSGFEASDKRDPIAFGDFFVGDDLPQSRSPGSRVPPTEAPPAAALPPAQMPLREVSPPGSLPGTTPTSNFAQPRVLPDLPLPSTPSALDPAPMLGPGPGPGNAFASPSRAGFLDDEDEALSFRPVESGRERTLGSPPPVDDADLRSPTDPFDPGASQDLMGLVAPESLDWDAGDSPSARVGFEQSDRDEYEPLYEGRTKSDVFAAARVAYEDSLRVDDRQDYDEEIFNERSGRSRPRRGATTRRRTNGERTAEQSDWQGRFRDGAVELLFLIVPAVILVLLIRSFIMTPYFIPSESMQPNLEINDRVLVNRLSYRVGDIGRGDIVVVKLDASDGSSERELIKRVIGLPGETLQIRDNEVIIDNTIQLEESDYLDETVVSEDFGPFEVPPGELFLMGDNRAISEDSTRSLGTVPIDKVRGRAFVRFWPASRFASL